jgi:AraC-like DNA-binding protein/mannose-6-phosphate isomerase-like protein (cupin superfamily)
LYNQIALSAVCFDVIHPAEGEKAMTLYHSGQYFRESSFPFYLDRYTIGQNEIIPMHRHDFVELVYVLEGNALHELAGNRYTLNSGDVFVIEPDVYHSYVGSSERDTIVYNVLFQKSLLRQELRSLCRIPEFLDFFYIAPFLRKTAAFSPYLSLKGEAKLTLESHLQTLQQELKRKESGYQLIVKTRLIECLVVLSRYSGAQDSTANKGRSDSEWLDSITSMLEQHFDKPFTLEQLSKLCGMSVSSFAAKFKQHTGLTLVEYRHDLQIRHACKLLKETDRKIIDIAQESGMEDISFFYKVFRKKTGMTPSQYRKRSRSQ